MQRPYSKPRYSKRAKKEYRNRVKQLVAAFKKLKISTDAERIESGKSTLAPAKLNLNGRIV